MVLTLLIVLPFTAPFSSCPLSLLLGDEAVPAPQTPSTSSTTHNAPISGALSVLMEEEMKDQATLPVVWEAAVTVVSVEFRTPVFTRIALASSAPIALRL